MEFIPYSSQNFHVDDISAVISVMRSEYLTQGPAVTAFEQAFADCHEVEHAVAVSNATAGLHIGCLAIGLGHEVRLWTSPNSFHAVKILTTAEGGIVTTQEDTETMDIDIKGQAIALRDLRY